MDSLCFAHGVLARWIESIWNEMTGVRALCLAGTTLAFGAALCFAQPANDRTPHPLPPGLTQEGGAIAMAPIVGSANDAQRELTPGRRQAGGRALSAADRDVYLRALQAGERGDWAAARSLAAEGRNPTVNRIVEWRYLLDKNSGASFNEIAAFLRANPDWPERDILFARAEAAMSLNLDPRETIAFFQGRKPQSSIGKIRLGEAYIATGYAANGQALIREAWIGGDFDPGQESEIAQRFSYILTADANRKRLDRLLFENESTAAKREMGRVPRDAYDVALVRLALRDNPWRGRDMIARLPASLQADPGLLFDRARIMRQQNWLDWLPSLLARASVRQLATIDPDTWWKEVELAARAALQSRRYRTAHDLVANSRLPPGGDYADAEFMAGWLDLRFLGNPREAHTHFDNIARAVTHPVNRSRAYYWAGRAAEAAGDAYVAQADYRSAAWYSATFYGQLALAKLHGAPALHLHRTLADPTSAERARYDSRELTRAMHVLGDLGMTNLLRVFAVSDAEAHSDPRHLELLASDLAGMGYKDVAVRVAKIASYSGVNLYAYSHPTISLPAYSGPGSAPEPAFALGIIRQETEFNAAAVSSSGARGMMQLMPSTAQHDAAIAGIDYRPDSLLDDPAYNERLGMVELASVLRSYGGSYILAAAAYNAGRGNVNRWIAANGDPRNPAVDPIDWIEEIPFAETRNYVQRVLENTEVYRNRLSGREEPLGIVADLYRGRTPGVAYSLRRDRGAPREAVANR